jgi:hypothetical protein
VHVNPNLVTNPPYAAFEDIADGDYLRRDRRSGSCRGLRPADIATGRFDPLRTATIEIRKSTFGGHTSNITRYQCEKAMQAPPNFGLRERSAASVPAELKETGLTP